MSPKYLFVLLSSIIIKGAHNVPINEVLNISLPLQADGHHLDARKRSSGSPNSDPNNIVQSNDITRDSYGNPVTPFHGLLDRGDKLNKNIAAVSLNRTQNGFVIPSYASGITRVETVIPNAPQFPKLVPNKNPIQFAETSQRSPLEINNFIVPPYRDDETRIIFPPIEVNTQPTLFFATNSFINEEKDSIPVEHHTTPDGASAPISPSAIPGAAEPIEINHEIISSHVPNNDGVYRGSFGGGPGILGHSQPMGWAHANKGVPQLTHSQLLPQLPAHPAQNDPNMRNQGVFLDQNLLPPKGQVLRVSDHNIVQLQQLGGHSQSSMDIYKGGFNGAPGILKPYDNAVPKGQ